MKISHGIEYLFVRALTSLFQILPHKAAVNLGRMLGKATDNVWLSRHKIILNNLKIAFGDSLTEAKRGEIARDVFANLGMTLAEVSRFPKFSRSDILTLVSGTNLEVFEELLKFGKGGLLVGSHFGNWELVGAYFDALGYPVDFLIRGQHNKLVDNYLTKIRESRGGRLIHSEERGGMKEILRALKANRQIALVSDQHAGSNGIIIKFFGRLVSVPRAPAVLSYRTGAPIVTGHILRNEDFTHHCVMGELIYPDTTADEHAEIYRLTRIYTERFEKAIRKYPSQWLWTHRRFKYQTTAEQREGSFVE